MTRVAFVTGGTRGIGRAICERLIADGHKVAAGYSGNEEAAAACAKALHQHELVKAKILQECPEDRHAVGEALAAGTGAALVQILGRTVLLYKRHPKEPKIRLPG